MVSTKLKLSLLPSRDIPLDKLRLSQSNVRRIKADVSIEELAEDIARRGIARQSGCDPYCLIPKSSRARLLLPHHNVPKPASSNSSAISVGSRWPVLSY
jgi:ParB family chromosome partitioning protein